VTVGSLTCAEPAFGLEWQFIAFGSFGGDHEVEVGDHGVGLGRDVELVAAGLI